MGKTTGISWTDHTFNPWWGCVEVSPACDDCYARTWANRMGHQVWGKDAPRRFFGDKHWNEPLFWNRNAEAAGVRKKVFCASMADICERNATVVDEGGNNMLDQARSRLWELVDRTPWLDWLLLTKRPHEIPRMIPADWLKSPRHNAWFGTTAENEEFARKRLAALRDVPNVMPWVSYEPALGPVDWSPYLDFVKWIIFGGESGTTPRAAEAVWANDTRKQCDRAGVSFFFKQAGNILAREWNCDDKAGKVISEWPIQFQIQEFPQELAA